MLWPRKYADESTEYQLKTGLRILGRNFRDSWLLSYDELQFGDQIHHELTVRTERFLDGIAPAAQLVFAFRQDGTDEALEGLREGRIRDVALVLVELAGGEQAARQHQHLVQLVDDRRLADPGITGHQHELRRASLDD